MDGPAALRLLAVERRLGAVVLEPVFDRDAATARNLGGDGVQRDARTFVSGRRRLQAVPCKVIS